MSTPLLPDALWNLIQPLLPPSPRRPKGGGPRLQDRACLTGILFVLRSGIPWEMLPQELGCGSGHLVRVATYLMPWLSRNSLSFFVAWRPPCRKALVQGLGLGRCFAHAPQRTA